jgi:hypothetical protein
MIMRQFVVICKSCNEQFICFEPFNLSLHECNKSKPFFENRCQHEIYKNGYCAEITCENYIAKSSNYPTTNG